MVGNENYVMPEMPAGCEDGIVKGIYKFRTVEANDSKHRVQLFGSGAIMNCVLEAQQLLADKFGISSDVWSVTSYTQLSRDAQECARWSMLHPTEAPKKSYLETVLEGSEGPFIAASDYVRAHSEQVAKFLPGNMFVLGCDGMGRSETREALRNHFEVDAKFVVLGTLTQLAAEEKISKEDVAKAIQELGIDPDKRSPLYA